MQRFIPLASLALIGGCSVIETAPQPILAPRAAEAIDPRVPIPDTMPSGQVDPALAETLQSQVGRVQAGVPTFDVLGAQATRLAAAAGPMASESWVAAQQALSLLIEQYGITTRAAADIDALAAARLDQQRWIRPADQAAIAAAASTVAELSAPQATAIERLKNQLAH